MNKFDNTYYRLFECGDAEAKKCMKELDDKDDDLVEKIMDIVHTISDENRFSNYARKEVPLLLRKLLQGRQPEKLTVTRKKIKLLVSDIQSCGTLRPCSSCIDSVIALFNLIGVKVVGK